MSDKNQIESQGYGSRPLSAAAIRDMVDSIAVDLHNAQAGVNPINHLSSLETKERAKFRKLARAEREKYT
jgi:hypothetical protein